MLGTSKESLLTSFISRVASGPPVTKWTQNFSKLVERCSKSPPDRLGPLLVQMEEWLVPSRFDNVTYQAQLDLLALWDCALRFSNERVAQQMHREVAFGLILLSMQRDDFSLTQTETTLEVRKVYNRLLLETFDRATVLLKFNSKSVGEVQFAATALAVFFFRLPLVSTMVVDAFQSKAKEVRQDDGFWVPEKPPPTSPPNTKRRTSMAQHAMRSRTEMESPISEDEVRNDLSPSTLTGAQARKSRLSLRLAEKAGAQGDSPIPQKPVLKLQSDLSLTTPQKSAPSLESRTPVSVQSSRMKKMTDEWNEADKRFVDANPDLFLWNASLLDSEHTTMVFNHVLDATPHWAKWLSTKESFFLSFVEMFVAHVQRCSTKVDPSLGIRWRCVPGYELVLSCFFPLLRSAIWWDSVARRTAGQGAGWVTSLQGYMRVKRTATSLLQADRTLLPSFVRVTFECTNLHSLLSVDSGIEHLNLFFTTAAIVRAPTAEAFTAAPRGIATTSSSKNESLPTSFDYDSFWESFSKMLDSESYQVLLKCCSFLYNNLHLFFGKTRTRMVNDLLCPKIFFRLFLHWSPEVRTCFHHLIVYKILRADRRYLPCFSDSQVMLLYGTHKSLNGTSKNSGSGKKTPLSSPRVQVSAKAAWGKAEDPVVVNTVTPGGSNAPSNGGGGNAQDAPATADEIAQLTRSAQRRLSLFDRANAVDDEELWSDMAFSSKIDSFVRMCLSYKDNDGGGVPRELVAYVEPALEQYSLLLIRYYRGATLASLDDIPDTLSHRMMLSEFTESLG